MRTQSDLAARYNKRRHTAAPTAKSHGRLVGLAAMAVVTLGVVAASAFYFASTHGVAASCREDEVKNLVSIDITDSLIVGDQKYGNVLFTVCADQTLSEQGINLPSEANIAFSEAISFQSSFSTPDELRQETQDRMEENMLGYYGVGGGVRITNPQLRAVS